MQLASSMLRIHRSVLFFFLLLAPVMGLAATYIVDNRSSQASDKNPGSESLPWKTIQKAANVMVAGDTVYVKQGVYSEVHSISPESDLPGLKPQHSGEPDKPIIYAAFAGHTPILDQQSKGAGFLLANKHHITIKGFEIRNVFGAGGVYTKSGSSHILVENCHIHDVNGPQGSNVAAIRFDWVESPIARNNRLHKVRVNGQSNQNAAGILSYGMESAVLELNEIYDAYNGIYHKRSSGKEGALIKQNVIHAVRRGIYYDVAGEGSPGHINQRVTQNIIFDTTTGIHLDAISAKPSNKGFTVWNNVIATSEWGVLFANVENVRIYNNVFSDAMVRGAIGVLHNVISIDEIDYNFYFQNDFFVAGLYGQNERFYRGLAKWSKGENVDLHSRVVAPNFVDPKNGNYALKEDSSLKKKGKAGVDPGAYP